MQGQSKTQRSASRHACWTLGFGGGAGFLGALAATHDLTAAAMLAVTAAIVAAAAEVAPALPAIINSLRGNDVRCINARAKAKAAAENGRQVTSVVRASINGKLEAEEAERLLTAIGSAGLPPAPRKPHEADELSPARAAAPLAPPAVSRPARRPRRR